jgi:4a-hydroxytetrahydrobiopterin dehydratase
VDLTKRKCAACEGGTPPLDGRDVLRYLAEVPGWQLDGKKIWREFRLESFVSAIAFVHRVADLAEAEGHHPDLHIHYSRVRVELWTHAIGGLSENDFILAAKINQIPVTASDRARARGSAA